MKISDPLGKVYTHTMFNKNKKGDSESSKYAKHRDRQSISEEEEEDIQGKMTSK